MLEVGYKSGCLKVISNDFVFNTQKIIQSVKSLAEQEWLSFDNWSPLGWFLETNIDTFVNYYKLNKNETQAFNNKLSMPECFVKKFLITQLQKKCWRILAQIPNVLWHKKNPNTEDDLAKAIINQQVYEVECSICGKHYFMDEMSICCVKRRSCSGADCLSHTLVEKVCTYKNLCVVNNESNLLQVLNTQLASVENIVVPLSYYGGYSELSVSYISDIHLSHHLSDYLSNGSGLNTLMRNTIKRLYSTMDNNGIIVFAGDISDNANITMQFYRQFVKYNDYLSHKNRKEKLLNIQRQYLSVDTNKQNIEAKINKLSKYIDKLKFRISKYLDFKVVIQYKNRYHKYDSWIETINCYKTVSSYTSKKISNKCNDKLDLIAQKLDLLESFKSQYEEFLDRYNTTKKSFYKIETTYDKSIKNLLIKDVYIEHNLLSKNRHIFVILGNHEYIGFESVQDAVSFYDNRLKSLGIKLLKNDYFEINISEKTCFVFGGTGFAKYNMKFNADNLVCCDNFTRDLEIYESTLFENEYHKAKNVAKNKSACFLCITHYPIQDCMVHVDSDTIYFYGHDHQNFYHKNEDEIIYADNQIGYKNSNIEFKTMSTGLEANPYFALSDGLYETTIKDYLQFYRYLGESVGDGSLLYQRCQNNKALMYVVKRNGYYGFFIVNRNKGKSKGISIVNGGKTKKITKSTDLQWLFNNFEFVLYKYLKVLAPLRQAQEQISKELKLLGLSGSIHGCIVDIDYYHHIMLNPIDGTMTYYYSSTFGLVKPLYSFDDVILSMKMNNIELLSSNRDYDSLLSRFNDMKNNTICLLSKVNESYLLESLNTESSKLDTQEQIVSRSEGMYGISRKINPLQRLFSSHTLRDFDLKLVEYQPVIESNNKSIKGKTNMMKCGMEATVIKDNGYKDITVQFIDGTKIEHCSRKQFENCTIKNPKL